MLEKSQNDKDLKWHKCVSIDGCRELYTKYATKKVFVKVMFYISGLLSNQEASATFYNL